MNTEEKYQNKKPKQKTKFKIICRAYHLKIFTFLFLKPQLSFSLSLYIYIYTYIYMCVGVCVCVCVVLVTLSFFETKTPILALTTFDLP